MAPRPTGEMHARLQRSRRSRSPESALHLRRRHLIDHVASTEPAIEIAGEAGVRRGGEDMDGELQRSRRSRSPERRSSGDATAREQRRLQRSRRSRSPERRQLMPADAFRALLLQRSRRSRSPESPERIHPGHIRPRLELQRSRRSRSPESRGPVDERLEDRGASTEPAIEIAGEPALAHGRGPVKIPASTEPAIEIAGEGRSGHATPGW